MARSFSAAANQYLQGSETPVVEAPNTFSAWVYPDSNHQGLAVGIANTAGQDRYSLRTVINGAGQQDCRFLARGTGFAEAISTATAPIDTWQHLCGVEYTASSRAAFLNGANKGVDATNSVQANLDATSIGRESDNTPSNYLDGMVAEVAIWNVALTDLEVHLLYRGYPPWLIRRRSLVGFWLPFGAYNDRNYMYQTHLSAFNTPTWSNRDPHHITSFRARAQFEPFASSRRRMSYGRYPGNLITRPWAYAPAAPVGGNPWYAYAQQ